MPHQDNSDLRTPSHELKELLSAVMKANFNEIKRHGNATIEAISIAVMATLTFGWSQNKTLGERFQIAKDAIVQLFPADSVIASSYQALIVTLNSCGKGLLDIIRGHFVSQLQEQSNWLLFGRPTFAIDGSQFAVPRTTKNLAHFAAVSRKSKDKYKNNSDFSKANTTQIAVSLCLHLTTGLPFFWNKGGSADSERGLLLGMLEKLPANSRLILDAYYFGYQFWNRLIEKGFTFVVRAGRNIELLEPLHQLGRVKCQGNLVLYWPQNVIETGGSPILLSLVEVMVGRKKMFLLTNELELCDQQLSMLYAKRWGIEVFFRTVKQSYDRAKMESRIPKNVEHEIDWTLLGVWMALTIAGKHIPKGKRASPIKVLRTLCRLVLDVARKSARMLDLAKALEVCFIADESNRTSEKNSKTYPRKKRKKSTGDPKILAIPEPLMELASKKLG